MIEKNEFITALQNTILPINPHRLQPPLHNVVVHGDIVLVRVAETKENEILITNDDDNDEDDNDDEDDNEEEPDEKEDSKKAAGDNNCKTEDGNNNNEEEGDDNDDYDEDDDDGSYENGNVDSMVMTNEEFFLDYTKEEYIKFASQTDIPIPPPLDPSSSTSEDPGNDNSHNNEDEV